MEEHDDQNQDHRSQGACGLQIFPDEQRHGPGLRGFHARNRMNGTEPEVAVLIEGDEETIADSFIKVDSICLWNRILKLTRTRN
jgi:hypothetical protein